MKSTLILGVLLLLGTPIGGTASADDGTYLNISVAGITYEEPPFPDFNPTMLVARFGKIYDNGLGFEARVGGTLDGDPQVFDIPILGNTELDIEVDLLYGLYFVAEASIGGTASIYAVAGVNTLELSATAVSSGIKFVNSAEESGAAFGGGITFGPSDKAHVTLEYMSYLDKDAFTLSTVSLGILF